VAGLGKEHAWGRLEVLKAGDRVQVKRLVLNPGARLSLLPHVQRAGHWVVVSGRGTLVRGGLLLQIAADESLCIPPRIWHAVANDGDAPLEVIEVQTGDHPGDEDPLRFADAPVLR
jgi:mannose-1-phosphate guanylyltransferase/mannose-6-phosphate isomerase